MNQVAWKRALDKGIDAERLRPHIREIFSKTGFKILIIPENHDAGSFESGLYYGEDAIILSDDYTVFSLPPPLAFNREIQEVKSIVESFKLNAVPPQDAVKSLFRREDGWRPDYRFFPQEGFWSFDAYKNRVAIEVLGENLDEVFKDCFKFLLAFKAKKVRFGVIAVPHAKRSSKSPDAVSADAILHRFSPVLQDYCKIALVTKKRVT